jgi:hypothetical protein
MYRLNGIDHPKKLAGKDPFDLYGQLCEKTGMRHDPCVIDVFMAAVDFMEGGEPKPWWEFTGERRERLKVEGGVCCISFLFTTKRTKKNELVI